jgi:hypothetical protein
MCRELVRRPLERERYAGQARLRRAVSAALAVRRAGSLRECSAD